MPKTPKSVKEATPRNLKMVSIDFFGAQKPKKVVANQPVTPTAKPVRNTALERLAKKAEERDNQAKGWSSSIKASFYRFFSEIGNEPGDKSRAENWTNGVKNWNEIITWRTDWISQFARILAIKILFKNTKHLSTASKEQKYKLIWEFDLLCVRRRKKCIESGEFHLALSVPHLTLD